MREKTLLDLQAPIVTETATFAMGCFWSPDALFDALDGVVRTRVGYAGGTTDSPTYWQLADHIETLQLDYDPARINYPDILTIFFQNHNPYKEPWKRQYMSALFYHNPEQEQCIQLVKEQLEAQQQKVIHTAVLPYREFHLAEDRHQKYKLQRQPDLMKELREIYPLFPDFTNSTAAARVNGYLYGYGNRERMLENITGFGLSPAGQAILLEKAQRLKEVYNCSG